MAQEEPDPHRIEALGQEAPPPVRAFVARKLECHHWAGEEPYDKARIREIRRAFRHLKCDTLDKDKAFLRKTYAPVDAAMEALDAARDAASGL